MEVDCRDNCFRLKRLIFIGSITANFSEIDWHLDDSGHKCDDLNGSRVEAAVLLTDYQKDESGYYWFDFMEFSEVWYRIQRVTIAANKSVVRVEQIERQLIESVFVCEHYSTTEKSTTKAQEIVTNKSNFGPTPVVLTTTKKKERPETNTDFDDWILLLIFLALIAIFFLTLSIYLLLWKTVSEERYDPFLPSESVGQRLDGGQQPEERPSMAPIARQKSDESDSNTRSLRSELD